jgi:hypothetical protein
MCYNEIMCTKFYIPFLVMKLEYVNLETKRRSVCQIQNNCKVYITEYKENSDEVEKDEEYISDEYELASLFSNVQDVL